MLRAGAFLLFSWFPVAAFVEDPIVVETGSNDVHGGEAADVSSWWAAAGRAVDRHIHSHKRPTARTGEDKEDAMKPFLKYLWWLVVLYFFWAMAEVCDEYFVPTIEVIIDALQIPEDVAGATIMALGCNGPELFINTVAIFQKSDLGVGAVVGGEVFNLLVLIGCAVIATPRAYLPLKIPKLSFSRDVIFYAASVGLLYWALRDNIVTLIESLTLLGGGFVYSMAVSSTSCIRRRLHARSRRQGQLEHRHLPDSSTGQAQHTAQAGVGPWPGSPTGATKQAAIISEAKRAHPAGAESDPETGCLLAVRALLDNRMQDRSRHWEDRFLRLNSDGIMVSTAVLCSPGTGRLRRGIVYRHSDAREDGSWDHAGLVNAPTAAWESNLALSVCNTHVEDPLSFGTNRAQIPARSASDPAHISSARKWECIPWRDVVACLPPSSPDSSCFEMQVLQRGDAMLGKLIRLELDAKRPEVRRRWVAAIAGNMMSSRRHVGSQESFAAESTHRRPSLIRGWLDWFRFPVQFLLRVTIPDTRKPALRHWVPVSFLMSMLWLAAFSFCVVQICDILSFKFGISVSLLGFTLAAIGTSFPNVISCIAVSRQGRTPMAIANALGANIQNVFLALALPWTIQCAFAGPVAVAEKDIIPSIMSMLVTLVLLLIVVLLARCMIGRSAGVAFLTIYVGYLVISIAQDLICPYWPLRC